MEPLRLVIERIRRVPRRRHLATQWILVPADRGSFRRLITLGVGPRGETGIVQIPFLQLHPSDQPNQWREMGTRSVLRRPLTVLIDQREWRRLSNVQRNEFITLCDRLGIRLENIL